MSTHAHRTLWISVRTAVVALMFAFGTAESLGQVPTVNEEQLPGQDAGQPPPSGIEIAFLPPEISGELDWSFLVQDIDPSGQLTEQSELGICRGLDEELLGGDWVEVPGGLVRLVDAITADSLAALLYADEMTLPADGQFVVYVPWEPEFEEEYAEEFDELSGGTEGEFCDDPDEQIDGLELTLLPDVLGAEAWSLLTDDPQAAARDYAGLRVGICQGLDSELRADEQREIPSGRIEWLDPAVADLIILATDIEADALPTDGQYVIYLPDAVPTADEAPEVFPTEDEILRMSAAEEADKTQSECLPTGPPPAGGYDPAGGGFCDGSKTISGVPGYKWRHGCGPTSAGMAVGFWDGKGCRDLICGNASSQTTCVNLRIASGDCHNGHYRDFSKPKDSAGSLKRDHSQHYGTAQYTHNEHCLADFMRTSWWYEGLSYGSSFYSRVDNAFRDYVAFINKSNGINYRFKSWNESYGWFTWSKFKTEINRNRPMVFLVDSDGNGTTDHFITAFGYRVKNGNNQYACRDTWSTGTRWERFRGMSSKYKWGISGATYFVPKGPASVSATDGKYCSYTKVTWSHDWGATGYTIWRGTSSASTKATQIATDYYSPYYDRTATPGKKYYYWVKASFGSASSAFSGYNTGYRRKTGTPTNLKATDATHCTFIRLTWTHTTCATSYEIWRSSTSQSSGYTKVGTDSSSPYDDTGTSPGKKYWYRIRATGLGGNSGFSNSDRGHKPFSKPSHPSNVAASDGSYCGYVRLSWSHVADATSYEVWRSTRSSSYGTRIGTDTASPYYDRSATPGKKYYYRLKAKSVCGTSAFSLPNSGYRKNCN